MRKRTTVWSIGLILAFTACGMLLIPDMLRAEIIKSGLQSKKRIEIVSQELRSNLIMEEIRKFGLTEKEAVQLQDALTDKEFVRTLSQFENKVIRERIVRLNQKAIDHLIGSLGRSIVKHVDKDLQKKLALRAEKAFKGGNIIASKLSANERGVAHQVRISEIGRILTQERLVAMGMNEEDASSTGNKLREGDLERILSDDVKIGHAAGWRMGEGTKAALSSAIFLAVLFFAGGGVDDPIVYLKAFVVCLAIFFLIWLGDR